MEAGIVYFYSQQFQPDYVCNLPLLLLFYRLFTWKAMGQGPIHDILFQRFDSKYHIRFCCAFLRISKRIYRHYFILHQYVNVLCVCGALAGTASFADVYNTDKNQVARIYWRSDVLIRYIRRFFQLPVESGACCRYSHISSLLWIRSFFLYFSPPTLPFIF